MPPAPGRGQNADAFVAAPPTMEQVDALLRFHSERTAAADAERLRLEKEHGDVLAATEISQKALAKLEAPSSKRTTISRDVSVLVNVGERASKASHGAPIQMLLTYVVSGASWSPSYDIRVDTTGPASELQLGYYGQVVNSSGEDWCSCRLALSTAQPSKAGMPPAPPRRMLRWQQEVPLLGNHGTSWGGGSRGMHGLRRASKSMVPQQACMSSSMMMERQASFSAAELDDVDFDSYAEEEMLDAVETASVAAGGGGTATFNIERVVTIESDSKPHKVTVALLSFEPQLLYFGTPTLEQACYLQLKAKNTSSFPLLASRRVSVFLDGSFVCNTMLKDVAPSEEFTTFLGVDAAIKLEHQTHARERKAASFMSKTQQTTHKFTTKLHNTKNTTVRLTVVEVLPKATEDKIRVELLQPPPKELKDSKEIKDDSPAAAADCVQQNKHTNNVVWQVQLAPGEKRQLHFEYTVSWPTDKTLASYDFEG